MNNTASFSCSICLESFTQNCGISTIPCGHVFHLHCISKWIGNGNQHCSQCRKFCSIEKITKLFFSENSDSKTELLEKENLKLKKELLDTQEEKLKLSIKLKEIRSNQNALEMNLKVQRESLALKDQKIKNLEEKVGQLQILNQNNSKASILAPKEPQVWLTLSNHKSDEEFVFKWLKANYYETVDGSVNEESMYQKYLDSMNNLGKRNVISKSKLKVCVRTLFDGNVNLVGKNISKTGNYFEGIKIRKAPLPLPTEITIDWKLFQDLDRHCHNRAYGLESDQPACTGPLGAQGRHSEFEPGKVQKFLTGCFL